MAAVKAIFRATSCVYEESLDVCSFCCSLDIYSCMAYLTYGHGSAFSYRLSWRNGDRTRGTRIQKAFRQYEFVCEFSNSQTLRKACHIQGKDKGMAFLPYAL